MKYKLSSLLLFSQAAALSSSINRNNYRENLCQPDLFVVSGAWHRPGVSDLNSGFDLENFNTVKTQYNTYCSTLAAYETALENKKKCDEEPTACSDKALKSLRVDETGIAYAKSCEQLKLSKHSKKHAWDDFMMKHSPCSAISTRPR
jgi:hypothetical protein